ncbi:tripartite tricarboxylate transporter substrate binding protein [Siccirubricoccus sp. KC 17139]|uniref:Tripartite tricarboxylate transporter substrate binding protein n=1 Tax=Siccirubricoccus soli TaxID=2899147 RepID=A0ABT1DD68_9PROT|nr:tripartite tricarboxylate transporter substrate binding protein [Siccirubricoccus soli]MCO6419129.1 tripartite tricarboxylate transporter substrate binding protein [Siccirubricoccus soli]MCP2685264.1 tripartite tricarboxylate transporter substrate binding protein [Siccirubricoccus soli]
MPRITRRALFGTAAGLVLATPALAAFPDRPLRIISGYAPGGLNDIVSRAMAQALTPILGQNVVVENRAGAAGAVGATAAARATPDGHTLWMGIVDTQAIIPTAYRNVQYDPDKDFAPISLVAHFPFGIVVGPSQPGIKDFDQLIAAAKAAPGKFSFASWGIASTSHLAMERVLRAKGVEMLHVPFTSQAPGMQAIMASQVDCMALPAGGAETMIRDGRTRCLAVIAPEQLELIPGVPTVREKGIDLASGLWKAIYAPAKTPPEILAKINAAVRQAMQAPSFIEVVRQQGAKPQPSTPQELAELGRTERAAWGEVVKATGAYVT